MKRRDFIGSSVLAGGSLALFKKPKMGMDPGHDGLAEESAPRSSSGPGLPDLQPARWIWYPSGRTLPNTFVLFRREIAVPARIKRAAGWIAADSRYLLEINGRRIQWGPAPADPRWPEADPLDLTAHLRAGRNIIGSTVLFYGHGDGTWPIGKPGFLFWLEMEYDDGRVEKVVSDSSWTCCLSRAWKPGRYKRWYLRALQEEFDARLHPYGWTSAGFETGADWLPAMILKGSPNRPALSTDYHDYALELSDGPPDTILRPRSIPMLREEMVPVQKLSESLWLDWKRPPEEYFDCRTPDAFAFAGALNPRETAKGEWQVELDGRRGAVLTFEFAEQAVGWPCFSIDAAAGTTVELLVHEAHQAGGPALLNTHFDSWSRFICREGQNRFEAFDFESLRWLQLHIHNAAGTVTVRDVGLRRRIFPWPNEPHIRTSEPGLDRLIAASVNTLHNCAQETLVDGMARERQQYSGDCGHQTHAIYMAFGETRLPARYLTTFSQGLTADGYFLDCWPAYDRLARLQERQLQLTPWGPILDHGIGFNFDCWHHFLYTGDLDVLREPYPRLIRFARYLSGIVGDDGLLPVEDTGVPSVWLDHVAYDRQRHKQCAFNLYAAAMLRHALAPLARAFGEFKQEEAAGEFGRRLEEAAVKTFWSAERGLFVNNLPWISEEKDIRLCDRSLATSILFNQCPGGRTENALRALADCPPEMGFSYPANAGWRLWALAKGGRTDIVVGDLRRRWAEMDSVKLNNTLQEDWKVQPDSGQQWSHCPVVPLYTAYMALAGIRPLTPGFESAEIRPQPADLEDLDLTAWTVKGPLHFHCSGRRGNRLMTLELPPGCRGELVLREEETVGLPRAEGPAAAGWRRYLLPAGRTALRIKYV
ncbi:MAG: alpha-L-rhamnosidase N-terminal domain-containing protein [Acidobacteriota bacterium]|nr:alpha-L-rhamnosidase N-terminal domain-containing protein [Acidobacteriota bacterium]